jgi:tetratricopeptide (TPR) repeat protein
MYNSKHYPTLLLLCLLLTTTFACNGFPTRASQVRDRPVELKQVFPGRGLRITEVFEGAAERAGLKRMDLIFRYGDFEILDKASFYAARDSYQNRGVSEVPIVIWRDGKALKMKVEPGSLGVDTNEYSTVAYQFDSLMMNLDSLQDIPEYMRDREFKDAYTPEKTRDEARRLIDQAESESTLTPTQILVARIYMIPDDASPEDLKRQSELLAQLVATQPVSYLLALGNDRFLIKKHHRPAIVCLKRYLEVTPDDATMRLNIGYAYSQLRMFAEAEAAADYVLEHQLKLSEHGQSLAFDMKAMSALSRGDYSKAISFAEKAFGLEQCQCDIALVMLAAAETGDLAKFEQASLKFQQTLPQQFEKAQFQLTAARALALVKNNQRDSARELVQTWKDKDRAEGRLKAYWKIYSCGSDVWTNWNELARN